MKKWLLDFCKDAGNFLKAYTKNWAAGFSAVTLLLMLIFLIFPSWPHHRLLVMGAGLCFLIASFRVYREQEKRIEKLTLPFPAQVQEENARKILEELTYDERDVLRYLQVFGGQEEKQLTAESGYSQLGLSKGDFWGMLMKAVNSGLAKREQRQEPGRGATWFYSINPTFVDVLWNELCPRIEKAPKRLFPAKKRLC